MRLVAATGASQVDFLEALTAAPDIEWSRVELFHLDEYIGLPVSHPASFRRYLLDRLIDKVGVRRYHLLDCENGGGTTADEVGTLLAGHPVDLALVVVGENAHLAFNDPPADFVTERPYLIVTLDAACRRQQVGEGWFGSVDEVPAQALSMSVRQILKSKKIIAVVPDARKAWAVKACVEGPVSPPGSRVDPVNASQHDAVSRSGFGSASGQARSLTAIATRRSAQAPRACTPWFDKAE